MIRKMVMTGTLAMSLVLTAYGNKSLEKQRETVETTAWEEVKTEEQEFSEQITGQSEENAQGQTTDKTEDDPDEKERGLIVEVNGQIFHAQFYDNDTANALKMMLPVTFVMNEHNGNEKYIYMDHSLPSASEHIGAIQNGDIMLFGSDCLVVFYKSFQTSYPYTRVGHISDPDRLADALGSGNVEVRFSME